MGPWQVLPKLNGVDVGEELCVRDGEVAVLETGLAEAKPRLIGVAPGVNAVGHPRALRLAEEAVGHGFHGMGLVDLLFKFEFHGVRAWAVGFRESARVDQQLPFLNSQRLNNSKLLVNRHL